MIKTKISVPKDLRKYVFRTIMKRLIPCIALIIVFSVVLLLWGDVIFNTNNKLLKAICYIIILILPIFITGLPRKIKDKTYYGEVENVCISTTTDSSLSIKPVLENLYRKIQFICQ